jgi:hypothetical protein
MTQVYMVEVMYNHHVIKRLKELERYWKQQQKKKRLSFLYDSAWLFQHRNTVSCCSVYLFPHIATLTQHPTLSHETHLRVSEIKKKHVPDLRT